MKISRQEQKQSKLQSAFLKQSTDQEVKDCDDLLQLIDGLLEQFEIENNIKQVDKISLWNIEEQDGIYGLSLFKKSNNSRKLISLCKVKFSNNVLYITLGTEEYEFEHTDDNMEKIVNDLIKKNMKKELPPRSIKKSTQQKLKLLL